ncbi:unnamed protein product, partial [Penicillium nalgiovense]
YQYGLFTLLVLVPAKLSLLDISTHIQKQSMIEYHSSVLVVLCFFPLPTTQHVAIPHPCSTSSCENMPQTLGHTFAPPEHISLDYECSDWRISSQRAADLYSSGAKLWTREDLKDIEQQLGQSYTIDQFSVRRIDGSIIQISNPLFQVQNSIWKPYIKYQEYWQLVKTQPNGRPETCLCSYIVDWRN